MDIEMTLPLSQRPIPDGALGDDERTETERSPVDESKSLPLPPRTPGEGQQQEGEDQDMDDEGDSPDGDSNGKGQGKKQHRRGKQKGGKRHRNWKPYVKLSWEERQKLDERETRRACKRREQRFASGHPLAPYNTTQFLMEQHPPGGGEAGVQGTQQPPGGGNDQGSNSVVDYYGSCSESYDSANDEDIFLEKDFSEAYETFHAERLRDMSKEELIKELLDLEAKVERMERRTGGKGGQSDSSAPEQNNTSTVEMNDTSVSRVEGSDCDQRTDKNSLEQLIDKLKEENDRLKRENEDLKIKSVTGSTAEEG